MLVAPVLPLPEGTPPPHHYSSNVDDVEGAAGNESTTTTFAAVPSSRSPSTQGDLFLYKARDCKSAPAPATRTSDEFGDSGDDNDSDSSSSGDSSVAAPSRFKFNSAKNKKGQNSKRKRLRGFCFRLSAFLVGHAPGFTAWATSFSTKSRLKYLSLFFLESSLRSIGDVTFCSNPFSGLFIFIAMLISCPLVAFLAFVTLTFGIETAVVFLHVPMEEIRSGVVTFNNFLMGTVVALIAQQDVILVKPDIIAVCIATGILTVIIWRGLNGLLAEQVEFPLLNAPFHLLILLYIYSGIASRYEAGVALGSHGDQLLETPVIHEDVLLSGDFPPQNASSQTYHLLGNVGTTPSSYFTPLDLDPTETFVEPLNWERIFEGILLAPSQVFGTGSLYTSAMVHFGVLLYSPIMLLQCLTGSAVGTLLGICLTNPEDYEALYNGSWGYNPLFTTAAIGGFFVVFNIHSWLLSIVGAVLTTLLYSALVKCHVPPLGLPFMLITWLLIPSIPLQSSLFSNKPSSSEVMPVGDDVEQDYHAESDGKKDVEADARKQEKIASGRIIRLHLSQITTPEEHRKYFLPKRKIPMFKQTRIFANGNENNHSPTSNPNEGHRQSIVGSIKQTVMNKYRASETPPQVEQIPGELSMGVGHHSILPL